MHPLGAESKDKADQDEVPDSPADLKIMRRGALSQIRCFEVPIESHMHSTWISFGAQLGPKLVPYGPTLALSWSKVGPNKQHSPKIEHKTAGTKLCKKVGSKMHTAKKTTSLKYLELRSMGPVLYTYIYIKNILEAVPSGSGPAGGHELLYSFEGIG